MRQIPLESSERLLDRRGLPLCIQQEHLLLSREYFRYRGVHLGPSTVPSILHLSGTLNYKAMEGTLNEIVRRHPALRAGFFQVDNASAASRVAELQSFAATGVFRPGLYRQAVSENARAELHVADPGAVEVQRQVQKEASREFNPAEPPLLRGTLIRAGTAEHFLILMVDHLVSDAWSMRIIRREFAQIHAQLSSRGRVLLEDPGLSYPSYALRQEEMAASGEFARALEYWHAQWSAYAASRVGFGDLPFSLPQPEIPTNEFASENSSFDPDASGVIRVFARHAKVTLYVLFLTAYARLLRQYTGKNRLAIWGHFANRMRPDVHRTVGWFANTHLLGIDLGDDPAVRSQLLRVRRTVLDASEHQEMPVALVWRATGSYPRHPDAKVLLDVGVADEPLPQMDGAGELRIGHATHLTPSFGRFSSLGLYIRDDRDRIHLSVQYSVDRFPQSAMQRLLADFQHEVICILNT